MGLPPTPTPTGSDAPWLRYQGSGSPTPPAAPRGAPVYIPPAPKTNSEIELERLRTEQARLGVEQAQLNLNQDRNPEIKYKPLSEPSRKSLEGNVSTYSTLRDAAGSFTDEYAGNTITGRAENWIQNRFGGFGSPGQAQWWARFDALDSQIRNDLYGSALTPTEKAAFDRTTINPSMDPRQIRENLRERTEIVRKALSRQVGTYRAGKIDPDVIDAAIGDLGPDLSPDYKPAANPTTGLMDANTGLSLGGPGRLKGADEDVVFGDAPPMPRGQRLTPEAQNAIRGALARGDRDGAVALMEQYTGVRPPVSTISRMDEIIKYNKTHPGFVDQVTFTDEAADAAAEQKYDREQYGTHLQPEIDRAQEAALPGVQTAILGAADIPTFGFGDEAVAGLRAITGKNPSYSDALQQVRARREAFSRQNPKAYLAGQLAGGFLLPGAAARSPGALARVGALQGGLYAAGSADPTGSNADSLARRVVAVPVGGALGGLAGYGTGRLLASRANARGALNDDVIRAAGEEGIPISRPIVDESARPKMGYLETTITGGNTVRSALDATAEGIENRAGALGTGGTGQTPEMFGTALQNDLRGSLKTQRSAAGRKYDRAVQMSNGQDVRLRDAYQTLRTNINELEQNANANRPLLNYLKEIRDDIFDENGLVPKSISAVRDLRTGLRGNISQRNLTNTDAERRIGQVLDAARNDIRRDLGGTNPAAVRLFREADAEWGAAKRAEKQVVEKVVGSGDNPKSGLDAYRAVMSMAKGDSSRLRRAWEMLPQQSQKDGAATIAETFGRKAPDEPFSPANFISDTRNISRDASETIFGPEGAKSLANLRAISVALRDTNRAINHSRSGAVINWGNELKDMFSRGSIAGTVGTLAGGPVVGAVAGATGAAGKQLGNFLSARALMSPDLTKLLRRSAQARSPSKLREFSARFADLARRDPALAQDVLHIQDALDAAFVKDPAFIPVEER